jgi:hypothetical protein
MPRILTCASSLISQAVKIFLPLSPELWACVFLSCFYAALCLLLVEDVRFFHVEHSAEELASFRHEIAEGIKEVKVEEAQQARAEELESGGNKLRWKEAAKSMRGVAKPTPDQVPVVEERAVRSRFDDSLAAFYGCMSGLRHTIWKHGPDLASGVYTQMISLVSAAPVSEPKTVYGRVINLGLGVFILIFVVVFTGATANTLASSSEFGKSMDSLLSVKQAGQKVLLIFPYLYGCGCVSFTNCASDLHYASPAAGAFIAIPSTWVEIAPGG